MVRPQAHGRLGDDGGGVSSPGALRERPGWPLRGRLSVDLPPDKYTTDNCGNYSLGLILQGNAGREKYHLQTAAVAQEN